MPDIIRLLPKLTSLRLYDNSEDGDPAKEGPNPKLVLHLEEGHIVEMLALKGGTSVGAAHRGCCSS